MTRNEALEHLGDGHSIWGVGTAKDICKAIGVPFTARLIHIYRSEAHPMGVKMRPETEGQPGVYALDLSRYVAEQVGVADQAVGYLGRGRQAKEYAELVAGTLE